jgi:Fe-Mn family superoxide dismutase
MASSRSRRQFIRQSLQGGIALGAAGLLPAALTACSGTRQTTATTPGLPFRTLPGQQPLPYAYNALEPVIDAQTMELHYSKHAAAYAKNLTEAMQAEQVPAGTTMETLMGTISKYSAKMRNNGGGHYNHELFWQCMSPNGGKEPTGSLMNAIKAQFTDFAGFKAKFTEAAMTRFGSGWAWLYLDAGKKLQIASTPNQDNPLMDLSPVKGIPLLGLDVWEHAYYLKYQNRRAEYVDNWYKLVNWDFVQQRFSALA